MITGRKNLVIGLVFIAAMIGGGCERVGKLDKSEQKAELMVKAYAMEDKGDYKSAIAYYNKTIEVYPQFARPHLDVALLYQEREAVHDYILAVYHYRCYLKMRPHTEKKAMIKKRIRESKEAFVAEYLKKEGGLPASDELKRDCEMLRNRNLALSNKLAYVERELQACRNDRGLKPVVGRRSGNGVAARRDGVGQQHAAVSAAKKGVAGGSLTGVNSPSKQPGGMRVKSPGISYQNLGDGGGTITTNGTVRSYTVRRGESLSRIALRVYGDATLWRKIQKANRDILGNSVKVRPGQVLKIP